jgi:hypothetical protein
MKNGVRLALPAMKKNRPFYFHLAARWCFHPWDPPLYGVGPININDL